MANACARYLQFPGETGGRGWGGAERGGTGLHSEAVSFPTHSDLSKSHANIVTDRKEYCCTDIPGSAKI